MTMDEVTAPHPQPSRPVLRGDSALLDDRYALGASLGRGGMAEVFRARDTLLERDVAVKVFHQNGALPDGDVRRAGEVRLLAGLSHPGLVTVFDAGRDTSDPADPFAYLVMELVDGTTLATTVATGPIPADELADLGAQLAGALAYVHERGVVHRDVKPANVLLGAPGRDGRTTAKLTDFGVARLLDSTRLTVHGTTLGTANYLSPEQATGRDVTAASDIYSLGLVLLECLTGEVAYPGHGVEAAVVRLHRAPVVPAWLTPAWRELIVAMTAFDPAARPDAAAVETRLRALAQASAPTALLASPHAAPPSQTTAAVRATGRLRTRRPLWLAGVLALVLAVAAVVIAVRGASQTSAGSPQPDYPAVAGTLGTDLRTLEQLAPAGLRADVLAIATRAAGGDLAAATAAVAALRTDLASGHDAGDFGDGSYASVSAATDKVAADLSALVNAAALSRSAASASAGSAAARQAAASRSAASRAAAVRAASASAAASRAAASRAAASRAAASRAAASRAAASRAAQPPAGPPGQTKDKGPGHGKGPGKP